MLPSLTKLANSVMNLRGNLFEEDSLAVIFTQEMLGAVKRRCCLFSLVFSPELSLSSMMAGMLRYSVLDIPVMV